MGILQFHGNDCPSERPIYSLALEHIDELPTLSIGESNHFVCCIFSVWKHYTDDQIKQLGKSLILQGCTYFNIWGPGCERAHDLIDNADLELHPEGPWAMTNWHSKEPLANALWGVLSFAWPDPAFEGFPHSILAITVNSPHSQIKVIQALNNLRHFYKTGYLSPGTIKCRVMALLDYFNVVARDA